MTRKDTIVIAVLLNVGLLIVLFTTSIKPTNEPMYAKVSTQMQEKPSSEPLKAIPPLEDSQKPVVSESKEKPQLEQQKVPPPLVEEKADAIIAKKEESVDPKNLIPVIVKQGDVLEKIAKSHHTTVEEVMKINRLPNTFLKIGQVLYIPSSQGSKNKLGPPSVSKPVQEDTYYTVKNGDNPWTIAVKNHIKVEQLLKLNELDEESAKKLKPGDRLRIK